MTDLKRFMKLYGISFQYLVEETGYSINYLNDVMNHRRVASPRLKKSVKKALEKYITEGKTEDPIKALEEIIEKFI